MTLSWQQVQTGAENVWEGSESGPFLNKPGPGAAAAWPGSGPSDGRWGGGCAPQPLKPGAKPPSGGHRAPSRKAPVRRPQVPDSLLVGTAALGHGLQGRQPSSSGARSSAAPLGCHLLQEHRSVTGRNHHQAELVSVGRESPVLGARYSALRALLFLAHLQSPGGTEAL